jgi:hypothetical protein
MVSSHILLCGKCRVPVEGSTDSNGHEIATCPKCGESDTFENATREAGEHVADKLVRDMFNGIGESTRGSSIMTITHPPQRSYRFITSDKSQ